MRKLPPLSSFRAFEAAARHLSFSRAAAELGVTPTAISHQFGCSKTSAVDPCFAGGLGRSVDSRPASGCFRVSATASMPFASSDRLGPRRGTEQRALRVTSPNAFASRWLVPRLPQWREADREVPPGSHRDRCGAGLRADEADVAIRYAEACRRSSPRRRSSATLSSRCAPRSCWRVALTPSGAPRTCCAIP